MYRIKKRSFLYFLSLSSDKYLSNILRRQRLWFSNWNRRPEALQAAERKAFTLARRISKSYSNLEIPHKQQYQKIAVVGCPLMSGSSVETLKPTGEPFAVLLLRYIQSNNSTENKQRGKRGLIPLLSLSEFIITALVHVVVQKQNDATVGQLLASHPPRLQTPAAFKPADSGAAHRSQQAGSEVKRTIRSSLRL